MDDHREADGAKETICRCAEPRAQGNLCYGHAPERRHDVLRARSIQTCGPGEVGTTKTQRQELAANYADYANGAQETILDAPHSRNRRNSRLILAFVSLWFRTTSPSCIRCR